MRLFTARQGAGIALTHELPIINIGGFIKNGFYQPIKVCVYELMAFLFFGVTVAFEIKFLHVHFIPSAIVVHNLGTESWTVDSYFSIFKQKRQGVIDIIVGNSGCFKSSMLVSC